MADKKANFDIFVSLSEFLVSILFKNNNTYVLTRDYNKFPLSHTWIHLGVKAKIHRTKGYCYHGSRNEKKIKKLEN